LLELFFMELFLVELFFMERPDSVD